MSTFVQFYELYPEYNSAKIRNSFSSLWNEIKNRGNIIWINVYNETFPKVEGDVYITCSFFHELDYVERWMKDRPDINFIVGGPAILSKHFNLDLPNFNPTFKQLYEILDITPTTDLWGIELPKDIKEDINIHYVYSLSFGNQCYWARCSFCRYEDQRGLDLDVKEIPILRPNHNEVWLNQASLSPKNILNLFPTFSNESIYAFYMRGAPETLSALSKVPISSNLKPMIGVEFPSDRMLSLMNKGTDANTMLNTILLFLKNGSNVVLTIIHGWPNLVKSDIDAVDYFLSKLEPYKKQISFVDNWLATLTPEGDSTVKYITKYDKIYYRYKLNSEQEDLNNKVLDLYKEFDVKFGYASRHRKAE